MSVLEIDIKREEVLHEVGRLTNYIGKKKNNDDGKYERIGVVDADNTMLSMFFIEGVNAVVYELKNFKATFESKKTESGEVIPGFFSKCNVSDQWNDCLTEYVNKSIFAFLVNYIVYRWLMITWDFDEAKKYDGIANVTLSNIIETMHTSQRNSSAYKHV